MNRWMFGMFAALFLLFSFVAEAEPPHTGELIAKFKSPLKGKGALRLKGLKSTVPLDAQGFFIKMAPNKRSDLDSLIEQLRMRPDVEYVQKNHYVSRRSFNKAKPSDPLALQQWNFNGSFPQADVRAIEAWDLGLGGLDVKGQEIAVAVVDGGVDIKHSDLSENIWTNANEVPNNGVDDDGNGYVDDYQGYNTYNELPSVAADYHGTHVAGIIGAQGGNQKGLVGVNWRVKIVPVQIFSDNYKDPFTTESVVKAYSYVIALKQQWLDSKGLKGANIVSTNSSFGVDYAKCSSEDFPVWDDMYNEMGQLGVVSAVATANNNVNVDRDGDVPSGCASDYIVSVTNTTSAAKKEVYAGWGANTVDIGAPGTDILSTFPTSKFDELSGTSMATPHVAGAVAFLHSLASADFNDLYLKDPAQGALQLINILLLGSTPQADLKGVTKSGGRLNLFSAGQMMREFGSSKN